MLSRRTLIAVATVAAVLVTAAVLRGPSPGIAAAVVDSRSAGTAGAAIDSEASRILQPDIIVYTTNAARDVSRGAALAYPLTAGRLLGRTLDARILTDAEQLGSSALRQRLQADGSSRPRAPLLVLDLGTAAVTAGATSRSGSGAIAERMLKTLIEVQAIFPTSQVAVLGPLPLRSGSAHVVAVRNGLRAAARWNGVPFFDPMAEHWLSESGSGLVQDGQLLAAGQSLVGLRLAQALAPLLSGVRTQP